MEALALQSGEVPHFYRSHVKPACCGPNNGKTTSQHSLRDIFEIETVGPWWSWSLGQDSYLFAHGSIFIDNVVSQGALVNGSSSVLSGVLRERIAKQGILPWFDRVDVSSGTVNNKLLIGLMAKQTLNKSICKATPA